MQSAHGLRLANAREFTNQAVNFEQPAGADALVFPEIGVALVSGEAAAARNMSMGVMATEDSRVQSIEPEYFMFAMQSGGERQRSWTK